MLHAVPLQYTFFLFRFVEILSENDFVYILNILYKHRFNPSISLTNAHSSRLLVLKHKSF